MRCMNHPKLKHPRLCRILTYVVVIGTWLLPIFIAFHFPVPDMIQVIVLFASLIGLIIYIVKNFVILMMMDMLLASLSCYRSARTLYHLQSSRTAEAIRSSILRFGIQCEPTAIKPAPSALQYKFSNPLTIYNSGIERVIAAYEVDFLSREIYRNIFSSAKTNSKSLIGKKKAIFLDSQQKKQPLHRVTVVLILAHKIDPAISQELYDLVCKQCGDEQENCFVPCIVDMERHTCVFNCVRVPYVGFSYAVKNRGIRIIKNSVFGGSLPLSEDHTLLPIKDYDPEMSLWDLWRDLHHQYVGAARKIKRQFESMSEREICVKDDEMYAKWDKRGVCLEIQIDAEKMAAKVEPVTSWAYPKSQPIGKQLIQKISDHIHKYLANKGYSVEFTEFE